MNTKKILGIEFLNLPVRECVSVFQERRGLLVVPAAPALCNMVTDVGYRQALIESDVAIPDSMYMVLLWTLFSGETMHKVSGLAFLQMFLETERANNLHSVFLVNPSDQAGWRNYQYLKSVGINVKENLNYTAPFYDHQATDATLVKKIDLHRPDYVIINIGGGTQEKLGLYLRNNLNYRPGILCTGAAIAFLTGEQAPIPPWADRAGLGWLWRCMEDPLRYGQRYVRAFKLARLLMRYRNRPPEIDRHKSSEE